MKKLDLEALLAHPSRRVCRAAETLRAAEVEAAKAKQDHSDAKAALKSAKKAMKLAKRESKRTAKAAKKVRKFLKSALKRASAQRPAKPRAS